MAGAVQSPTMKSLKLALFAGLIVVIVLVAAVPWLRKRRAPPRRNQRCITKLRQIDGAKDVYFLHYGPFPSNTVLSVSDLAIYIKDINTCFCPSAAGTSRTFENSYSINALTAAPTCKVGTNAAHDLGY